MQRLFNYFLFALSVVLFISLFACHDECPLPEDPNACTSDGNCDFGKECDNGTCKCPADAVKVGQYCIKTPPGIPSWNGISSSCYCYDSLSMGISGTGTNRSLGMSFIEGGNIGSATTFVKYFEKPDGDSMYIFQMPIKCLRPGYNKMIPEAFGKIAPDGDMVLRLVFRDGITLEYIDECVTTLKRAN